MGHMGRIVGLFVREVIATPLLTAVGVPDSRTRDHRGRRISVRRRLSQDAQGRPIDPESRGSTQAVARRLRAQGVRMRAKVSDSVFVGVLACGGMLAVGAISNVPIGWKQAVAGGALAGATILLVDLLRWRVGIVLPGPAKEVRSAWLAERMCPACGYDLARLDMPPEPDGCTICPECASAWDLRR